MEANGESTAVSTKPRLTRRTLFVLGSMTVIDCINVNLLSPYVDEMVSSFLQTSPEDPRVETTVGLLVGLYSFCEVVFSVFWGYLSDRIGRKPVILIGLAGSAVAPIVFGLAPSLAVVFVARGLDGFFCGNNGVVKTYLGEIVDKDNEAQAFSLLAICFSCGLLIGPLLGGELVHPAKLAPGLFAGTVFERFPYLLPNVTYACLAVVAWIIGALFLEETLPRHSRRQLQVTAVAAAPQQSESQSQSRAELLHMSFEDPEPSPPTRTGLCHFIMTYSMLSGYFAAWVQNFILLVSLPTEDHGFGFGPRNIGLLQNFAAVGLMLTQFFMYTRLTERFGFLSCFTAGIVLNLLVTLPFPAYELLADPEQFAVWRYVPLAFMQFFGQIGAGFCFPTVFVWLNRASEGADRGTANGIANSSGAFMRSISPPIASSLLALGLKSGVPGGRFLPIFVNSIALMASLGFASAGLRRQRDAEKRELHIAEEADSPVRGA